VHQTNETFERKLILLVTAVLEKVDTRVVEEAVVLPFSMDALYIVSRVRRQSTGKGI
jgi:hypothetical protein